ncbi:hypothetical protein HanPI659440_Chr15g0606391 [Helianthus annuus]|nr:hypothetical protein HanPI659440_Chr15g0606391 [Helianthus annuus]
MDPTPHTHFSLYRTVIHHRFGNFAARQTSEGWGLPSGNHVCRWFAAPTSYPLIHLKLVITIVSPSPFLSLQTHSNKSSIYSTISTRRCTEPSEATVRRNQSAAAFVTYVGGLSKVVETADVEREECHEEEDGDCES